MLQSKPRKLVISINGLPGSGKTTLARKLQNEFNCPWYNADKVRASLCSDLGFSKVDRCEQARRLACIAALSLDNSEMNTVVVDFVNPTLDTMNTFKFALSNAAFESDFYLFSVFMNTIKPKDSRYADTAAMFDGKPEHRMADVEFNEYLTTNEEWDAAVARVTKKIDLFRSVHNLS